MIVKMPKSRWMVPTMVFTFGLLLQATNASSSTGSRGGSPPVPRPSTPQPANSYDCAVKLTALGTPFVAKLAFSGVTPMGIYTAPEDWKVTSAGQAVDASQFPMSLVHSFGVGATFSPTEWLEMELSAELSFFAAQDVTPLRNTLSSTVSLDSTAPLSLSSEIYVGQTQTNFKTEISCKFTGRHKRFDDVQSAALTDVLLEISPATGQDESPKWAVKSLKCRQSDMELVGVPGGPPFTHREFNDCTLVVNGQELEIGAAQAKKMIDALNIDWVRDSVRDSRSGMSLTLSLSALQCSRSERLIFGVENTCSGLK